VFPLGMKMTPKFPAGYTPSPMQLRGWLWRDVLDITLPPANEQDHAFSHAATDLGWGRCYWCGHARHSGPCLDRRFARQRRRDIARAIRRAIEAAAVGVGNLLLTSGFVTVGILLVKTWFYP
jgi:hypothetical protein